MNKKGKGFDPESLERRMWTSYFNDGLWDILFGLLFIGGGLRTITDNIAFTFFPLLGVIVLIYGRRHITFPRLGRVEFGPKRKKRSRIMVATILAVVIFTFALWMITTITSYKPDLGPAILMVTLVPALFLFISWLLQFWRLAVYGILFTVEMALYEFVGDLEGSVFALALGSVVLSIGIVYLARFMRRYPGEG